MGKRTINVVSAAIERDGSYLITQRLEKAVFPLLWEFPGGKMEEGESKEDALARELKYRLGVDATVAGLISETNRAYPNYDINLYLMTCDIGEQEPQPLSVRDLRWVSSAQMGDYEFVPADEESMDKLLR
jgi:8-oxo-dGTP diphosphatase